MKKEIQIIFVVFLMFLGICSVLSVANALVFERLNTVFHKVFNSPLAVTTVGEISYPGDTFQYTFTLKNNGNMTYPETDASDGKVYYLYKAYRMLDQAGNKIQEGYEEITTTLAVGSTTTLSVSLPIQTTTPSGNYAVSAVLFVIPMSWNRATNTWSEGTEILLDKQAIQFQVQTPTPPPKPTATTILNKISNIFASIWNWIKGLFGW